MKIPNIIKQTFCPHLYNDQVFIKNLHGDEINKFNARSIWQCKRCGKLIYSNEVYNTNNISDGYHTFGELYEHREVLTAALCQMLVLIYGEDKCWKSTKHSDGTMYDNMFIVGIETISGTATYHYDQQFWDDFDIKILDKAPEFDGHTSLDVISRIDSLRFEPKPTLIPISKEELDDLVKMQKAITEKESNQVHIKKSYKKKSKKSLFDKIFDLF